MKSLQASICKFFFFALSCFSLPSMAASKFSPFPEDLKYSTSNKDVFLAEEQIHIEKLDTYFADLGFEKVITPTEEENRFLGVDQVYWNTKTDQAVLVKYDVAPETALPEDQALTVEDAFVMHTKLNSGLGVALMFDNLSSSRSDEIFDDFNKIISTKQASASSLHSLLVTEAHAWSLFGKKKKSAEQESTHKGADVKNEEKNPKKSKGDSGSEKGAEAPADEDKLENKEGSFAQHVGQCLAGIGKGLYDSTIGMAINVGKGAIKLVKATAWAITHPKQAWSKTRKRWSEFKSLMKAATSYAAYDTGFGRKDDKFSGYYLGLEDVGYDVQGENGKGDKKSKSSKKTGKGPTYKEDKKNQPKKSSAYSLLTPTQKTKFVCRLVAMFGVAGASWYFMAGNVPALASEVQSFLSGSATVASSESGRKFFMEGEFAKYQESLGEKHKQLKADQIEFSRQWARKNPKEAAAILARYHK